MSCFERTSLLSFRILNRSCWQSLVVSSEERSLSDTALDFLATTCDCGNEEKFILTAVAADFVLMGKGSASVVVDKAFASSSPLSNCFKVDSGDAAFSLLLSSESCWSTLGRILTSWSHERLVRSPHWSILLSVALGRCASLGRVVTPDVTPAPVWWQLTRWWAPGPDHRSRSGEADQLERAARNQSEARDGARTEEDGEKRERQLPRT